jgi:glycerophosphoryl diester phosphodiesterase
MPDVRPQARVRTRHRTAAVALVAVTAVLMGRTAHSATTSQPPAGFIAHAFGSPPTGETYTNSLEAFRESYSNGFRVFEVDMVRLKDGRIALAHDRFETRYGLPAGTRFSQVTSAQMTGRKLDGQWPVLLGSQFLHLVKNHPDAKFVLDTKGDDVEIAAWFVKYMAPSSLARVFPHVYSQAHLNGLKQLYRWPGYVVATYRWAVEKKEQKTVELVSRNNLQTVMIRPHEISPTFETRVRAAGARHLFVHSLTAEADILAWRAKGWGVYSNGWIGSVPTVPIETTPPTEEPMATASGGGTTEI